MADETMQAQPVALDTVEQRKNLRMLLENSDGASSRVALDLLDEIDRLQANEPRAIIRHFARAMERKLAANDAVKGGWRDTDWFTLHRSLMIETRELLDALNDLLHVEMGQSPITREDALSAVLAEAADVSNFAMCIADACGALPPTDDRGR